MSHIIYSLIPKSYIKKSHYSSNEFRDIDNFLIDLQRKADSWNYKLEIEDTSGSLYKIKFNTFEHKFLKKPSFVLYVVNAKSEDTFKNCIHKLLKSCKDLEKLSRVVILSLNISSFEEIHGTKIKVVCFGIEHQTEDSIKWDELEGIFKNKFDNHPHVEEIPKTDAIPIPMANTGRRSPSKLKIFFNSLPAKFDNEKRKTLFSPKSQKDFEENHLHFEQNENLPNINVSNIDTEESENVGNDLIRKNKVDSTKLSLNSLFRKRSKKSRNSGISLNSSTSTGSGSQKSDTTTNRESLTTFGKESILTSADHSPTILTASLHKPVKHKAKIEIFKSKANKVIRSTSCLQSPEQKRSKYCIKDVVCNMANFSSSIMTASSDIVGNQSDDIQRKKLIRLLGNRGQSEPPNELSVKSNSDCLNGSRIKYYSWHEDSSEEKEIFVDEIKDNNFDISGDFIETPLTTNNVITYSAVDEAVQCNESTDFVPKDVHEFTYNGNNNDYNSEVFHTNLKLSNTFQKFDENQDADILVDSYPSVSFSTFIPQDKDIKNESLSNDKNNVESKSNVTMSVKNENSNTGISVFSKKQADEQMESLDKLIKSIQISCEEMRAARKSQSYVKEDSDDSAIVENSEKKYSYNSKIENGERIMNQNEVFDEVVVEISNKVNYQEHTISSREMSPEMMAVADSFEVSGDSRISNFRKTCHLLIRNPIVVTGIFAATAFVAPVWFRSIPHNISMTNIFYDSLDYLYRSDIVQSLPNQIISGGRNSASAATSTIKRLFF